MTQSMTTTPERLPKNAQAGAPKVAPPCDVFENEREIVLLVDLPGAQASALSVQVDRDVLTIEAARAPEPGSPLLREHLPRDYRRAFTLPQGIDQGKIEAKLEAGVLRVRLPKEERLHPRKIEVRPA